MTPKDHVQLSAIAAILHSKEIQRSRVQLNKEKSTLVKTDNTWNLVVRLSEDVDVKVHVTKKDDNYVVKFESSSESYVIKDSFTLSDNVISIPLDHDEDPLTVQLINRQANGVLRIRYKGTALNVLVMPEKAYNYSQFMIAKPKMDTTKVVLSPMPGVVKGIAVEVGDMVGEGQECCIVEAMKMQNSLKAGITGKVKSVNIKVGETVEEEQILIELE